VYFGANELGANVVHAVNTVSQNYLISEHQTIPGSRYFDRFRFNGWGWIY